MKTSRCRLFQAGVCATLFFSAPLRAEPLDVAVDSDRANDPLILQGDFVPPQGARPVLICLHGLGSGRAEWDPLVQAARARGWGAYLFDLRGHGKSRTTLSGRAIHYEDRTVGGRPEFWQAMPEDLLRVAQVLETQKGVTPAQKIFVGASLGANIAVLAASTGNPAGLVLLSPGVDYAGLQTDAPMRSLKIPALIVTAATDLYAHASAERLIAQAPPGLARWTALSQGTPRGDHGTQLFDGALEKKILDWVGDITHTAPPQKPSPLRKRSPKR